MTDPRRVDDVVTKLGDIAAGAGLRRITMLAWRDLDDPEAGGSEIHASRVAELWGRAGIEVTMRTSYAPGTAQVSWRDGYRVIRNLAQDLAYKLRSSNLLLRGNIRWQRGELGRR